MTEIKNGKNKIHFFYYPTYKTNKNLGLDIFIKFDETNLKYELDIGWHILEIPDEKKIKMKIH